MVGSSPWTSPYIMPMIFSNVYREVEDINFSEQVRGQRVRRKFSCYDGLTDSQNIPGFLYPPVSYFKLAFYLFGYSLISFSSYALVTFCYLNGLDIGICLTIGELHGWCLLLSKKRFQFLSLQIFENNFWAWITIYIQKESTMCCIFDESLQFDAILTNIILSILTKFLKSPTLPPVAMPLAIHTMRLVPWMR